MKLFLDILHLENHRLCCMPSYWTDHDCITYLDYFPERRAPVLSKLMKYTLNAATAGVLVGCYQLNMHDVGLTELIARTWTA
jgi:hypothetical protein